MDVRIKFTLWRLVPVAMTTLAAAFWFDEVQGDGAYLLRNLIPLVILVLLSALVLYGGGGQWGGLGNCWPLGIVGYAIPALGLGLYLHYAYAVNLNGMFTDAAYPERIFRYLPVYTIGAGGIGFAIGWIVGRKV